MCYLPGSNLLFEDASFFLPTACVFYAISFCVVQLRQTGVGKTDGILPTQDETVEGMLAEGWGGGFSGIGNSLTAQDNQTSIIS